eukprot:scpid60307/ scgid0874/ 
MVKEPRTRLFFECLVCRVALATEELLGQHNESQKHKLNAQAAANSYVENIRPLYCVICKLELNSKSQYHQHVTSKKHKQIEADLLVSGELPTAAGQPTPLEVLHGPVPRPPVRRPAGPVNFAEDQFDDLFNGMEQTPTMARRAPVSSADPSNTSCATAPQAANGSDAAREQKHTGGPHQPGKQTTGAARPQRNNAQGFAPRGGRGGPPRGGRGAGGRGRNQRPYSEPPRPGREPLIPSAWHGEHHGPAPPFNHHPQPWYGGDHQRAHHEEAARWHEEERRRRQWHDEQLWRSGMHHFEPRPDARGTDRYFNERPSHHAW